MPPRARHRAAKTGGRPPIISLLTDFGLEDIYVGVMKGVIASIAPEARVIDICHGVRPQDVAGGGFRWAAAVPFFPPASIHVAVVDPGVGGPRRIAAVRARGSIFLAPDNGLLGFVAKEEEVEEAVEVRDSRFFLTRVSTTFHGRDIFAPVAARLALGLPLGRLGPPAGPLAPAPVRPAEVVPSPGGTLLAGRIVDIDNFGNCITNIPVPEEGLRDIRVGRRRFYRTAVTYGVGSVGEPLAVIGSSGFLEIAVNRGRADRALGLRRGMRVTAWRR